MKYYIAGLLTCGNIKNDILTNRGGVMRTYLVNPSTRQYVFDEIPINDCNILESFIYIKKNERFMDFAKYCKSFLLDSGAFTFLKQNENKIDWDNYLENYASFINKYDIRNFFELDIDSIVGLKEVERLRKKLELLTGKLPIPVWHKGRGKEYFLKMCDEYPYIALGGIAIKEIPIKQFEPLFPWFINEAHKRGVKIHGLGYTSVAGLKKYKFDSVDSTRWLHGNVGGFIYHFDTELVEMKQIRNTGRLKSKEGAINNFREWVKFSKYAEIYL